MLPAHEHIGPTLAVQILLKTGGIDRFMCLRIKTIPTQDMVASAADKDVRKQVRQLLFPPINSFEEFFQVWRVNRQVSSVVLVEKLDLVVDVPCTLVPGRSGQEATAPPGGKEGLNNLIPLGIRVSKVMAFINEHKITILVTEIIQKFGYAVIVVFPEKTHREDVGVELVNLIVALPHLLEGSRTNDQRPRVVCSLEMLHDGRTDVTFAKPHHICHKPAAKISDHLHRLPDGNLLETRQLPEYVVVPKQFLLFLSLQAVSYEGKQRLHVDVVWFHLRCGPG